MTTIKSQAQMRREFAKNTEVIVEGIIFESQEQADQYFRTRKSIMANRSLCGKSRERALA